MGTELGHMLGLVGEGGLYPPKHQDLQGVLDLLEAPWGPEIQNDE